MNNKKQVNRRAITSAYLTLTENCNLRCTTVSLVKASTRANATETEIAN